MPEESAGAGAPLLVNDKEPVGPVDASGSAEICPFLHSKTCLEHNFYSFQPREMVLDILYRQAK